ncbi:TPA: hypothetical protein N0F65_000948, partial [Lagenidium giganteum]
RSTRSFMATAQVADYGTIAAVEDDSALVYGAAAIKNEHPECTCSWLAWLLFWFHEDVMTQLEGRSPSSSSTWLRRMCASRRARLRSMDQIAPLPADYQCSHARTKLGLALQTPCRGLWCLIWIMERRRLLRISAWAVLGTLANASAGALLLLLIKTLTIVPSSPAFASLCWQIVLLQFAHVMAVVADEHAALETIKTNICVSGALQSFLIEYVLSNPLAACDSESRSVGSDEDVEEETNAGPPHTLFNVWKKHIENLSTSLSCYCQLFPQLAAIIGDWLLLEALVGAGIGTMTVLVCLLLNCCVGCALAMHAEANARWFTLHRVTAQKIHHYFKWLLSIRLYAWDAVLAARVLAARKREHPVHYRALIYQIIGLGMTFGTSRLAVGLVLLARMTQGSTISINAVFAVALFAERMSNELHDLSRCLVHLKNGHSSAQALDPIVIKPLVPVVNHRPPIPSSSPTNTPPVIALEHVVIVCRDSPLLQNVTFSVQPGELVLIHGSAGAGKSMLLHAITGSAHTQGGWRRVAPGTTIAYCAQEHWLQTKTIRDNIVFGLPFDESKYMTVVAACSLLHDLRALPGGDQTVVGPLGAAVSGGQRARIALARACYADADVYLLDCTLDCLDPIVQTDVFDKCVHQLLQTKTVLLVTHNPELLSKDVADRVLEVRDASVYETRVRPRRKDQQVQPLRVAFPSWSQGQHRPPIVSEVWSPTPSEDSDWEATSKLRDSISRGIQSPLDKLRAAEGASVWKVGVFVGSSALVMTLYAVTILWMTYKLQSGVSTRSVLCYCAIVVVSIGCIIASNTVIAQVFTANLDGASYVCSLGPATRSRLVVEAEHLLDLQHRQQYACAVQHSYSQVCYGFLHGWFLLLVLWISGWSTASPAERLFVLFCAVRLPSLFRRVDTGLANLSFTAASADRIESMLAQAAPDDDVSQLSAANVPAGWPTEGNVRFDKVWFEYPCSQFRPVAVLRNVTFDVNGGDKVGIVGRSGSGKSSIAMALFRAHELTSGRIVVDGVDISTMSVTDLRKALCIIPQSPVFYRCTLREYLDPNHEFDDSELWRSLHCVGLAGRSDAQVRSLGSKMTDDGTNWSSGQRQLLSLARAVLKPSRVLMLDEAFGALDQARDESVLQVVHREFGQSTMFVITHRMDQVLDFDRVIVMDDGRVVEMGIAHELLTNPDSRFFELLETSPLTM